MKNYFLAAFLLLLFSSFAPEPDKPAFTIFDKNGNRVSFEKMIRTLKEKDLVFFGEQHDNPIAHWLQLELTMELHKSRKLMLGAEMFEADNQAALNAYLRDSISQKGLDTLARLWNNYKTDYKPLLDFAKQHGLSFVATNTPRKYARMVHKKGLASLDSLPATEKNWFVTLPLVYDPELPAYKRILEMMGDHASPGLVNAQAFKDATMAHFILKNRTASSLFLHYNGSYHSDDYEGILWFIRQQAPQLLCGTISTVSQADVSKLEKENKGKADFIIVVDQDMTKTF